MNNNAGQWMAACAAGLLVAGHVLATDGTWTTTGTQTYTATNNWAGGSVASGVGSTMTFAPVTNTATTINLDTNAALGSVVYSSACGATLSFNPSSLAPEAGRFLTLDSGSPGTAAPVWLQRTDAAILQALNVPLRLNSDLLVRNDSAVALDPPNQLYLYGNIGEGAAGRSLTILNAHSNAQTVVAGSNTFSGNVVVSRGMLRLESWFRAGGTGVQLGLGNTVVATGGVAVLDLSGFSFGPEKTLLLGGMGGPGQGALASGCQSPAYTSVWAGAVSLAANAAVGVGHTYWSRKNGGGLLISGTISDGGNGYQLEKRSGNTLYLRGNNTYGGGTVLSNGYVNAMGVTNLGTGPLIFKGGTFQFGQAFDLSALTLTNGNNAAVTLDTAGLDVTLAGNLPGFANGLTKAGAGTLTLSGTNSYKGATMISRGTLKLDYATQNNSKVDGTATGYVRLFNDATLQVSGGTGSFTQSLYITEMNMGAFALTNLNAGAGTVLNVGTINRYVGSAITFGAASGKLLTSQALANNILGGYAAFGDSTWATKSGSEITGYTGYSGGWGAASNVDVTVANVGSAGANALVNSLRFNNSDSAGLPVTLTLTGTNALASGGILVTPALGANPVTIAGGTLTSQNSPRDLIVIQSNTNAPLIITSSLTNNGVNAIALTKAGPGTLALSNSASLYAGNVYVNGGVLEVSSALDLGATNAVKTVFVNNGSTLRFRGSYSVGSAAQTCGLAVNAGGGTIDIPGASDRVYLTGVLGLNGRGEFTKTGAGTLALSTGYALADANNVANLTVAGGTLDIGTVGTALPAIAQSTIATLTVKNGATLKGGGFLNGRSNGANGGAPQDECNGYVLRVDGTGGTVDLNGVSVSMGAGGNGIATTLDFLQGSGRLAITNSSATPAKFTFRSIHNTFTGILDIQGDYYGASGFGGALPNGELRLGPAANVDFSWTYYPMRMAFGALTGPGRFGGIADASCGPVYVGDDRAETFEFSGTLWAIPYNAGPVGFRYVKTGRSAWRISGATNDIQSDFTVRCGTVLTGSDSLGKSLGALGKAKILLGDFGTGAGDVALLTDGPYMIGNVLVLTNTSGTVTLGGHQTAGASAFTNALNLTRNVILTSANTDSPNGVTFSGKITGSGGITKTGPGTVYLTGVVSNTGPTSVQQGSLVVQGNVTLTNTLTVTAGASGTGTLTVSGNLSLGSGATLAVSVGTLVRGQTYTLVSWTGTRGGSFAPVTGLPNNWHTGYRSNSFVLYYAAPGTMIGVY